VGSGDYSTVTFRYGSLESTEERLRLITLVVRADFMTRQEKESAKERLQLCSKLAVREHVASANDLEERIRPSHSCDDLKLLLHADGAC
jgi:hypothetical protein